MNLHSPIEIGETFEHTIRVYYADTDAAQVVYHAAYLNFFSNARVEWLRQLGWGCQKLDTHQLATPVRKLEIHYKKPARIDDLLIIRSKLVARRPTLLTFHQIALRQDQLHEILCEATIEVACVDAISFKPTRFPF